METAATSKTLNYNANQTTISGNSAISTSTDTSTSHNLNATNTNNVKTETIDLSSEVEESKGFLETIGDGLSAASNWALNGLKGIGASLAETAANVGENVESIANQIGGWVEDKAAVALSTSAVVATSVFSGIMKIDEGIEDGIEWVGGKVVEGGSWVTGQVAGAFSAEAKENIDNWRENFTKSVKEDIARDKVAEANQMFYEGTDVGRWLNDHSAIKYDSEEAKKIQDTVTVAGEIAAATAITVATAGTGAAFLAPFLVGAAAGTGKAAESTYQNNGTDTTFLQELGIAGSGALTGLAWVANGKLGQGALEIGKDIIAKGGATVLKDLGSQLLNKEFVVSKLKEGLSLKNPAGKLNINALMNYGQSVMGTAGSLTPYITGEEEFNATAALKISGTFLGYLGLNILEDTARDYVSNYKATGIVTKALTDAEVKELEEIPEPVSASTSGMQSKGADVPGYDKGITEDLSNPENYASASIETSIDSKTPGDVIPSPEKMATEDFSNTGISTSQSPEMVTVADRLDDSIPEPVTASTSGVSIEPTTSTTVDAPIETSSSTRSIETEVSQPTTDTAASVTPSASPTRKVLGDIIDESSTNDMVPVKESFLTEQRITLQRGETICYNQSDGKFYRIRGRQQIEIPSDYMFDPVANASSRIAMDTNSRGNIVFTDLTTGRTYPQVTDISPTSSGYTHVFKGEQQGTGLKGGHFLDTLRSERPNFQLTSDTYTDPNTGIIIGGWYDADLPTVLPHNDCTFFPQSWSESKVISAIQEVGSEKPIAIKSGSRAPRAIYAKIIDGIEVVVMKDTQGNVISAYPQNPTRPITIPSIFIDLR